MTTQTYREAKLFQPNLYQKALDKARILAKSPQNAYERSMTLLVLAACGDTDENYNACAADFNHKLTRAAKGQESKEAAWIGTEEVQLWLKSRELWAMHVAMDFRNANILWRDLDSTILEKHYKPNDMGPYQPNSVYAMWALGWKQAYEAVHFPTEYTKTLPKINAALGYQLKHFKQSGNPGPSLSDMLWSYATAMQAAAFFGDKVSYNGYVQGFCEAAESRFVLAEGERLTLTTAYGRFAQEYPGEFGAWMGSILCESERRLYGRVDPALVVAVHKAQKNSTKNEDRMMSHSVSAVYPRLKKLHSAPTALEAKL